MQKLHEWLLTCPNVISAKPVRVELGKHVFEGAFYVTKRIYQYPERAVAECAVPDNTEYTRPALYLLGKIPNTHHKTCYEWISGHPLDHRVVESADEWYVAGYYQGGGTKEQEKQYHPFGHYFLMMGWEVSAYGPYKGIKIDWCEASAYRRAALTVEYLDQTPA